MRPSEYVALALVLTSILGGSLIIHIVEASQQFSSGVKVSDNTFRVASSSVYVSVPFYYQSNNYYCGPAALEMVFDYYGEDVLQVEIADAARTYPYVTYTDELLRASHFSNLSTSFGDEMPSNITGYSTRKFGYAAFEKWGLAINDLKDLVDLGQPTIVLMWWTPAKQYGHYRVVIGYNDTHIIMHDPWNKDAWGGTYGGCNTSMTYSTFLDLWEYSNHWGLWVHPWTVKLQVPSTIKLGDDFQVMANITYSCAYQFYTGQYPASSCNATIRLPEGLTLVSGDVAHHSLGDVAGGSSVQTEWTIHANETGLYNITVTAAGIVEGSVWGDETYPSYDYEDAIGGFHSVSMSVSNQTIEGDINGDNIVDIFDAIILAGAFNSEPGDPDWKPEADINNDLVVDIFDAIILSVNFGESL